MTVAPPTSPPTSRTTLRGLLVGAALAALAVACGPGTAPEGSAAAAPAPTVLAPAETAPGAESPVSPPQAEAPASPPRGEAPGSPAQAAAPGSPPQAAAPTAPSPASPPIAAEPAPPVRPAWLGTRPLPLTEDGFGQVLPTPPELVDRRLPPPAEVLPPPTDGAFAATVADVPPEVAARSTWQPACPVELAELRYLTVAFHGFDERLHTGELLVHADVADDVVEVFRRLHDARFPLEEVRVIAPHELDLAPTGDGNTTTSFVCRPVRQGSSWSEHAYGRALDVNPFHNPYRRGEVVLPELASAYLDRADERPGMVVRGGPVTEAFAAIGWSWGGDWESVTDSMHFSRNGR